MVNACWCDGFFFEVVDVWFGMVWHMLMWLMYTEEIDACWYDVCMLIWGMYAEVVDVCRASALPFSLILASMQPKTLLDKILGHMSIQSKFSFPELPNPKWWLENHFHCRSSTIHRAAETAVCGKDQLYYLRYLSSWHKAMVTGTLKKKCS